MAKKKQVSSRSKTTKPKKLTPAQLAKKRSLASKKGWITKRAIKKNRSLQSKIKKTGSKKEIARLKREIEQLHHDYQAEMQRDARTVDLLEAKLKRYDPLDVKQLEYFGPENYKRLRDADNFFAMADKIAQEMEISTKEVFSNWMSP